MSGSFLRARTRRVLLLRKVHNKGAVALGSGWTYRRSVIYLLAVGVIALLMLSFSVHSVGRAFLRWIDKPPPVSDNSWTDQDVADLSHRLDDFERDLGDQKLALSEGIQRVDRAEKRVQKTVTSARRLVRDSGLEHAGIEAEYEEIHEGDDSGVDAKEVLALPEAVVHDGPSGIPGLSKAALAEIRSRAHV